MRLKHSANNAVIAANFIVGIIVIVLLIVAFGG